jgi:hypothetical protein
MIDEYEFYHGAVIRMIVTGQTKPTIWTVDDTNGRVDSFVADGRVAVHIKHSKKRLAPWQFTFTRDNIEELIALDDRYKYLFITLVCGSDGIVTMSPREFLKITGPSESDVYWIRANRSRNTMYSKNSSGCKPDS